VFGSGITSAEFSNIIGDSLLIVTPAAVVLILVFLVFSYRDPIDLLLGIVSLVMALIWTFDFMGIAGIPFSQLLIAIPPLLLAVGIDFGIHAINRYREERVQGRGIDESMRITTDQLLVAFFIVTGTTVFGFGSNVISDLQPTRQFGIVAAVGIVFTFLIFGVFLPAAKVWADRLRDRYGLPEFGTSLLGEEGSIVGRVLTVGVFAARKAPYAVLALALAVTVVGGFYATDIRSSFSNEDFLPPEDDPDYVQALPEPFAPSEYSVTETTNYLEDNFASGESDTVTIYVEGPLRQDNALERIQRANRDPPDSFIGGREPQGEQSIITVIDSYAEGSPEFRRLVERNDIDDDGVPEDNLAQVYDALLSSPARGQALNYITEEYGSTRIVYSVESDATQQEITDDARELASDFPFTATATGGTVVFQAVSDIILDSAIGSLVAALIATAGFLVLIYWIIEDRPSLGIVNLIPIVVAVTLLGVTMVALDLPLNALTATILSVSIGLGIDYAAHFVHRFVDEYHAFDEQVYPALEETVRGTGGALAGSMLTTTTGTGVLALAITPILGQFGLLIALSVFYSFIASILVAPSVIVLWDRWFPIRIPGLGSAEPGTQRSADD
jgi:predicted RND superfamily exporter protein